MRTSSHISTSQGAKVAPSIFFFGCRHRSTDFLYAHEWGAHVRSGILDHFFCAFSRDSASLHLTRDNIDSFSEFLDGNRSSNQNGSPHEGEVSKSETQSKKVYVQHLIRENKETVWEFLKNNAVVCLSGSVPTSLNLQNLYFVLAFLPKLAFSTESYSLLLLISHVLVHRRREKMPTDVRNALKFVAESCGNLSADEAEAFLTNLTRANRYLVETWS